VLNLPLAPSLCLRMHRYAYCLMVCTARQCDACFNRDSFTQYLRRCT
jgi:hypothetical protein